jgi:hypothetical protein
MIYRANGKMLGIRIRDNSGELGVLSVLEILQSGDMFDYLCSPAMNWRLRYCYHEDEKIIGITTDLTVGVCDISNYFMKFLPVFFDDVPAETRDVFWGKVKPHLDAEGVDISKEHYEKLSVDWIEYERESKTGGIFVDVSSDGYRRMVSNNDYMLMKRIKEQNDTVPKSHALSVNRSLKMESEFDNLMLAVPTIEEIPFIYYPNVEFYLDPYKGNKKLKSPSWEGAGKIYANVVLGQSSNNTLDIQENEKVYFDKLKNLIVEGLKLQFPGKSLEELEAAGIADKDSSEYLMNMCHLALRTNYMHTGAVRRTALNIEQVSDIRYNSDGVVDEGASGDDEYDLNGVEDDEDLAQSMADDKGEGYTYYHGSGSGGSSKVVDLLASLKFYVDSVRDSYRWAETLIILLRFGKRKPTKLKLKNADTFFDLNTFSISKFSGDMASVEEEILDEASGSNRAVVGLINLTMSSMDRRDHYINSLGYAEKFDSVLGLILASKFKGVKEVFRTYIDIPSIVDEYYNNGNKNFKIMGITATPSGFVVDEDVLLEGWEDNEINARQLVSSDMRGSNAEIYQHHQITKDAIKYNVSLGNYSVFQILIDILESQSLHTHLNTGDFSTVEELQNKFSSGAIVSMDVGVRWKLCNQFIEPLFKANDALVASRGNRDMEEILNTYRSSITGMSRERADKVSGAQAAAVEVTEKTSEFSGVHLNAIRITDSHGDVMVLVSHGKNNPFYYVRPSDKYAGVQKTATLEWLYEKQLKKFFELILAGNLTTIYSMVKFEEEDFMSKLFKRIITGVWD